VSYTQFQSLYRNYSKKGFEILAFPCNQFGNQEPGTNAEIVEFVKKYHVTFPMFSKIDVNGPTADPLFTYLKHGVDIRWNFEKFLCDRNGKLVKRYLTSDEPFSFRKDIISLLSTRTRTRGEASEQSQDFHLVDDEIL